MPYMLYLLLLLLLQLMMMMMIFHHVAHTHKTISQLMRDLKVAQQAEEGSRQPPPSISCSRA